ncbi:MAG TPA: hypothetical protein VF008_13705 [Niastella sp.]
MFISLTGFNQNNYVIKPGNYDEMLDLSYDKKSGIISGIIATSNNGNTPRISCSLIFKSSPQTKMAGPNKYPVGFYNEGDTAEAGQGYIEIKNNGVDVKCNGTFSSCQNLIDLGGETGWFFEFTTAKPFISANIISNANASIYKTASDTAKTKMYLIKNNFISIITIKDNWVSFEYMNPSGKRIKGWLKKEDIALRLNTK